MKVTYQRLVLERSFVGRSRTFDDVYWESKLVEGLLLKLETLEDDLA